MNEFIRVLSYGIPIEKYPFRTIAERLKISEDEVIEKIKGLKNKGIIRFFRPRIDYRILGYKSLLVGFYIEEQRINEIASCLKGFNIVSHCYIRKESPLFPYNLFLMLHAKKKEEFLQFVERIVKEYNILKYTLLFTKKEFKGQRPRIK
ncbi:MAG: Lrp/AsnC family transcriptional regulator [bacterium]